MRTGSVTEAWNESQVFGLRDLGIVFGEMQIGEMFLTKLNLLTNTPNYTPLNRFWRIYMLRNIEKYSNILLGTGYITPNQSKLIKQYLVALCDQAGETSVNVVDAITTSRVFDSVLGQADGDPYPRYIEAVENAKGVYDKPGWLVHLQRYREKLGSR